MGCAAAVNPVEPPLAASMGFPANAHWPMQFLSSPPCRSGSVGRHIRDPPLRDHSRRPRYRGAPLACKDIRRGLCYTQRQLRQCRLLLCSPVKETQRYLALSRIIAISQHGRDLLPVVTPPRPSPFPLPQPVPEPAHRQQIFLLLRSGAVQASATSPFGPPDQPFGQSLSDQIPEVAGIRDHRTPLLAASLMMSFGKAAFSANHPGRIFSSPRPLYGTLSRSTRIWSLAMRWTRRGLVPHGGFPPAITNVKTWLARVQG